MYTKEQYLNIINKVGRDLSRSPMQWDDTENSGFSNTKPWFKVCRNYK